MLGSSVCDPHSQSALPDTIVLSQSQNAFKTAVVEHNLQILFFTKIIRVFFLFQNMCILCILLLLLHVVSLLIDKKDVICRFLRN